MPHNVAQTLDAASPRSQLLDFEVMGTFCGHSRYPVSCLAEGHASVAGHAAAVEQRCCTWQWVYRFGTPWLARRS